MVQAPENKEYKSKVAKGKPYGIVVTQQGIQSITHGMYEGTEIW